MTDYRYIFGTLRSEQVIEEIALYGVYMTMEMNVGGELQGTFQLDQTGKDNATLLSACIPGATWVACERNGVCVWHGFIWILHSQKVSNCSPRASRGILRSAALCRI